MWKLTVILLISASVLQMIDAYVLKPEHKCMDNQYWTDHGPVCPPRCNGIGFMLFVCPEGYVKGCFCRPPYIFRSGTSGTCVLPKDCPKIFPILTPNTTAKKQ
ncbi:hypothetical protein GDO78_016365 [Eleutherodactylus coqui]|uniref:TIL domain-containing protein n=1 Tax=Eleutherodactylus coqui TaxID=57060 RepID=A0A8J6E829_ELECQ|nr:hypothetical protein GDO78_016365 [Eleutherodactylus coqui]